MKRCFHLLYVWNFISFCTKGYPWMDVMGYYCHSFTRSNLIDWFLDDDKSIPENSIQFKQKDGSVNVCIQKNVHRWKHLKTFLTNFLLVAQLLLTNKVSVSHIQTHRVAGRLYETLNDLVKKIELIMIRLEVSQTPQLSSSRFFTFWSGAFKRVLFGDKKQNRNFN